jgi:hypothetical protein
VPDILVAQLSRRGKSSTLRVWRVLRVKLWKNFILSGLNMDTSVERARHGIQA